MNSYDIWSEGYIATGVHSTAKNWGKMHGTSFKDACARMFKDSPYYNVSKNTYTPSLGHAQS